MNCPNCTEEFESGNVCPTCGVDTVLFVKTCRISDLLYNKALSQAKRLDLTGAIDNLDKSIEFNKNNCDSRNLLGLIYFETGMLADALKQFIISASIIKEKNLAREYLERIQKAGREFEIYNEAVKMYNQALVYLNQKSEDMAIIQLKKAIELNPKFVAALNLLTLCYFITREKEKIEVLVEKVLSIDAGNPIASNYYKELYPTRAKPTVVEPQKVRKVVPQPYNPSVTQTLPSMSNTAAQNTYSRINSVPDKKSFGENFYFAEILSFVFGVICTFAIFYILVLPGKVEGYKKEIEDFKTQITANEKTYKDSNDALQVTIEDLKLQNTTLKDTADKLGNQVTTQEKLKNIQKAEEEKGAGKFESAYDIIAGVVEEGLPPEEKQKVIDLKKELAPKSALYLYNSGMLDYNAQKYDLAREKFTKAYTVSPNANICYYLGMTEKATNNVLQARKYFQEVLDTYSSSNQVNNATQRLAELQ